LFTATERTTIVETWRQIRTAASSVPAAAEAEMTKRAHDKIMAGLDSARAYLEGTADKRLYRVHVPEKVDVKKIRAALGLSQESFSATYGIAISAVRDWEQGRRRPEGAHVSCSRSSRKKAVTRALSK
jgi:putative transcriptional regulator